MPQVNSQLHRFLFSTDHQLLVKGLCEHKRLLLIQDLDGVCMGLVRNPLTRTLDPQYISASKLLDGHFYVLTNGEHVGSRGVNCIVDTAMKQQTVTDTDYYLPGLAGGGVQWQDADGQVSHPGVSESELSFLRSVPDRVRTHLTTLLSKPPYSLSNADIDSLCDSAILDNLVSPTININVFHQFWQGNELYLQLQRDLEKLMQQLLNEAAANRLQDSFFIHYAPNLGRSASGERIKFSSRGDSGTTDFQFMLKGAIKEVGVLVILNHYYFEKTGNYPLGRDFSARSAPHDQDALLQLAVEHFDPQWMPRIVGVGDTVTSNPETSNPESPENDLILRGGSDRGFLTLIQELGKCFASDNVVLFVDSSGGELDRPGLQLPSDSHHYPGIRDQADPLKLNFVFPEGHQQYVAFFRDLASEFSAA